MRASPAAAGRLAPPQGFIGRLRLLQLRLWLERLAVCAGRGLCFGLAVALGGALTLVAQAGFVDRANLLLLASGGMLAGLLCGLLTPPSLHQTARTADLRYGLEARLGTAIELLRRPIGGRIQGTQLQNAALALRGARGGWPLPPLAASREALVAAGLALLIVLALNFEGRGRELLVNLPVAQPDTSADFGDRQTLPAAGTMAQQAASADQPSSKTGGALRMLDELRRGRESGTLSPEQAQRMLEQVESELGQRSAETRRQRETLDRLARALSQVSAAEAAGESIEQGDLAKAGQQLAQLGQEADQLSPEAKRELSQALRRAAAESPSSSSLASRERRAADALAGRDYQAQQSALAALGQEVAASANQSASAAEVADAAQRLQQERAAAGSPSSGGDRAGGPGADRNASGQAGGSQAGTGQGANRGGGPSNQAGPVASSQSGQLPSPSGPAEKLGPLEGSSPAPPLDAAGQSVEVPARPTNADPGQPTDQTTGDEQLIDRSTTSFDAERDSAPVQAGGQAERIVVPGDQRQVVRDYFARRGRTDR